MTLLLTGATGFLGSYLASRLPAAPDCVVRGRDPQSRLNAALAPLGARGRAVAGDLAGGPLDIDVSEVTHIVHCAADVAFTRPLAEARTINVGGARRVVELAERAPRLERVVHVSTSYVAGRHAGSFGEDDLDRGQSFRNTYEQTKFEAEQLVRSAGLPLTVVRPSIVVGESTSGWTSSFNVLYPPLRAFARGLVERVPADPSASVDVVPVDHVAEVILSALEPDAPDTLHAVAGDAAPTTTQLAELAATLLERPVPALDPGSETAGGLEVYAPYFTVRTRFDARRARSRGLVPPPLADYLPRVLAFADTARWGKRIPPLREARLAA
jgi:nucleoside-diphosphate-sugar epimerase